MENEKSASKRNWRLYASLVGGGVLLGAGIVLAGTRFCSKGDEKTVDATMVERFDEIYASLDEYRKTLIKKIEEEPDPEQLRAELTRLLGAQFSIDEFTAQTAFKKSKEALNDGNVGMAKIYCLNAINHDPAKVEYLEAYRELFKDPADREELSSLLSVLDFACYRVNPESLEKLKTLIEGMYEQIKKKTPEDVSASAQENPFETAFELLSEKAKEQLEVLEKIEVDDKTRKARLSAVAALLAQAESELSQSSSADDEVGFQKLSVHTEKLQQLLSRLNDELSREHCEKALKILDEVKAVKIPEANELVTSPANGARGELTKARDELVEKIRRLDEAVRAIVSKSKMDELKKLLEGEDSPAEKLRALDEKRRIAYNLWAVREIQRAHEAKSEKDKASKLKRIEQALLTPAVSGVYATVYSKAFAENVDAQIEIAKAKKCVLTDF